MPGWVLQFALSPDGKTLAVDATQQLHAVLFVSVPDGKEIRRIEATSTSPGANLYFNRLDFSPDGKTLAAVGNDSVCRLFEVGTGKTILHLTGEVKTSGRFPTAFSPDGKKARTDRTRKTRFGWWKSQPRRRCSSGKSRRTTNTVS